MKGLVLSAATWFACTLYSLCVGIRSTGSLTITSEVSVELWFLIPTNGKLTYIYIHGLSGRSGPPQCCCTGRLYR